MVTYTGQRVGYMRVSSVDQNLDRQSLAIGGCGKVFSDKAPGKGVDDRQGLREALNYLREGDLFVVASMDRLARSLRDLESIVTRLTDDGVTLHFVKEDLVFRPNSEDPYARFQLHLIGAVAELERSLIRERQREGIEAAKARGVYTGRARVLTDEQAREAKALAKQGMTKKALAQKHGIGRSAQPSTATSRKPKKRNTPQTRTPRSCREELMGS